MVFALGCCGCVIRADTGGHASMPVGTFDYRQHPEPEVAAEYQKASAEIESLQAIVQDTSKPSAERMAALMSLRSEYPDAAIVTAAKVVQDADTGIASTAVEILESAVVMSNHDHAADELQESPYVRYMTQKHEFARAALRKAIDDARAQVRNGAAATLSSLSDESGVQAIVAATEKGLYKPVQTINYIGLAKSDVSGKYLEQYLKNADENVKAAAVGALAQYAQYEKMVKDDFLYNKDAPLQCRQAAAKVLVTSASDALLLISNVETPPALYQQAIRVYLGTEGDRLTPEEMQYLQRGVKLYSENWKTQPQLLRNIDKEINLTIESRIKDAQDRGDS